jgi:hypothetical protein
MSFHKLAPIAKRNAHAAKPAVPAKKGQPAAPAKKPAARKPLPKRPGC